MFPYRPLLLALAIATTAALGSAAAAATARPPAVSAKKTCIVHRYTSAGQKIVFRVYVYRYKKVRRHGQRVRIIVRSKLALRGSCSPSRACVKVRVGSSGRLTIVTARRRVLVRTKRGNRLVNRRVTKRVPVLGKCKRPNLAAALGVPVRITILPESKALLDFGAFQREMPVAGTLIGYSPQRKIDTREDIPVILTSATVTLGSTPIQIDDVCGGKQTAALRTGRSGSAKLSGSRDSTALLTTAGAVTATAFLTVRLPLELRDGETGCEKPYIDTQYSEWPFALTLSGRRDPKAGGLTKLHLRSAPAVAKELSLCMNPGLQTEQCTGFQIPLPIPIATDIYVKVELNPKS